MDRARQLTLFELFISIVVIAVLSAILFSRYLDFQSYGRAAKMQSIYGAIKTAATLAKAVCIIDLSGLRETGTCTEKGGKANMSGVLVNMVNQYPAATKDGIINALQLDSDNLTISGNNPLFIDFNGAPPPTCRVSYSEAKTLKSVPEMTINTTGC